MNTFISLASAINLPKYLKETIGWCDFYYVSSEEDSVVEEGLRRFLSDPIPAPTHLQLLETAAMILKENNKWVADRICEMVMTGKEVAIIDEILEKMANIKEPKIPKKSPKHPLGEEWQEVKERGILDADALEGLG